VVIEDLKDPGERSLLDGLIYFLNILLAYKWLIMSVTFVVTAAVVVYCYVSVMLPPDQSPMPNQYSANAIIIVQQNDQNNIADTILEAMGASAAVGTNSFNSSAMLMEVLRSRTLIDSLIKEFSLNDRYGIPESAKGQARNVVMGHLRYYFSPTTGMLSIMYTDTDPVMARDIVNRLVELLDRWVKDNYNLDKQRKRELLEKKLTEVDGQIITIQKRLQSLRTRYGVMSGNELGAGLYSVAEEFNQLTNELEVQQRIYNTLSPQFEAAKLSSEYEQIFQIFELAETPDEKSGPRRSVFVMMAFGGSFVGSSILAVLLSVLRAIRLKKKASF